MRPIARPQSALRTPLNAILGTEAHVRILRVLAGTSVPMAVTEVADRAMVNLSGAVRALATLEEVGIVARVGAGRRQSVTLGRAHPLAPALETLFAAENGRVTAMLERLTLIIGALTPPPKSVWIEGTVATQQDRVGDPLRIGLLTAAKDLPRSLARLESDTLPIQREFDVTIEVRGLTEPDLAAMSSEQTRRLNSVLPMFGPPPASFLAGTKRTSIRRTHAEIDGEIRARAAAVAVQLTRDPGILERAQRFLRDRIPKASSAEQRELREWETLLSNMTLPRLRRFLVDPGERATRLRQTMPFLAVRALDELARPPARSTRTRRTETAAGTGVSAGRGSGRARVCDPLSGVSGV